MSCFASRAFVTGMYSRLIIGSRATTVGLGLFRSSDHTSINLEHAYGLVEQHVLLIRRI